VSKTKQNATVSEFDRALAVRLIENPSATDEKLAIWLQVSRQTINRHRNSEVVQSLVGEALTIPVKELQRLLAKSLMKIETHLDDSDPRISLPAAVQIIKMSSKLLVRRFETATPAEEKGYIFLGDDGTSIK